MGHMEFHETNSYREKMLIAWFCMKLSLLGIRLIHRDETLSKILQIQRGTDMASCKPCTDYLGNHYSSQEIMCEHYNIKPSTYLKRIARGATQKEALTKKVKPYNVPCTAYGVEYSNKARMLEAHNMCNHVYDKRISEGKSVEQALSHERFRYSSSFKHTDPWGMVHESERKMCEYHGVNYNTYRARKYKGYTLEECLQHGHLYPKNHKPRRKSKGS